MVVIDRFHCNDKFSGKLVHRAYGYTARTHHIYLGLFHQHIIVLRFGHWLVGYPMIFCGMYHQFSNIRRIQSQNINVSRLVLQLTKVRLILVSVWMGPPYWQHRVRPLCPTGHHLMSLMPTEGPLAAEQARVASWCSSDTGAGCVVDLVGSDMLCDGDGDADWGEFIWGDLDGGDATSVGMGAFPCGTCSAAVVVDLALAGAPCDAGSTGMPWGWDVGASRWLTCCFGGDLKIANSRRRDHNSVFL